MGSVNSPNPWSPFETYKDCSQGTCSVYCPQWCYIIFPPPPSGLADDDHDDPSIFQFSPLIVAVIGILASAFILVCYYTIISKYCRRRGSGDTSMELNDSRDLGNNESLQASSAGLDESIVKAITVYRYKKVEGLVEGTDCSVCLSEFQENESLRLLPKCNHAFHLPCIDIWLKSHSTCPLCRSNISSINPLPPQIPDPHDPPQETQPANRISALQHLHGNHDTILAIQDIIVEGDEQDEAVVSLVSDVIPKTISTQALGDRNSPGARDNTLEIRQDGTFQPFRRSHSMNYSSGQGQVSAAHDILRTREDDVESSRSGVDHEENRCNTINNSSRDSGFDKSPPRMKRSISTGRFMFARYSKGNNSAFPN
ncbi:RING-H2 finger protein ATL52-like [Juglans microcarpa x Juglans regia]|uniref:RING-H2 finger protein ATL52-like n=1 Tax=Juglans microcarpa x Juglans regia TaxID=2249226 RepID=UPI001B7F5E61|nr:RING-H2 finger protein ATL52-like [Juglans microcarpa x Juglans regia]